MKEKESSEQSQNDKSEIQMQNRNENNMTAQEFMPEYTEVIQEKQNTQCQKHIKKLLQNIYSQVFITVLALFSLFSDDIRQAATDASADPIFDGIHITLMTIFTIQLVLSWISIEQYRFSFFFFLDLISTLSLVLDISMITVLMYSTNGGTYNLSRLVAQSRVSRVATRAVRIVKLVRIIRIVKLYKAAVRAAELREMSKKRKLEENKKKTQFKTDTLTQRKSNEANEMQTEMQDNTAGDFLNHDDNLDPQNEQRPSKTYFRAIKKTQLLQVGDQSYDIRKSRNEFQKSSRDIAKSSRDIQKSNQDIRKSNMSDLKKSQLDDKKADNQQEEFIFNSDFMDQMSQKQSKISKVLSDLTIKKIIIAVILLMFVVPLFDSDNYTNNDESWDYFVVNIHKLLYLNDTIPIETVNQLIETLILSHQDDNNLIYFSTPFKQLTSYQTSDYASQRIQFISQSIESIDTQAIMKARPTLTLRTDLTEKDDNQIYAIMDYRVYNQRSAYFSMAKTLFVCIVLVGMLHFFSEDIDQLIVDPIEKMMDKVMEMAKNPESVTMSLIDNTQYETAIVHNAIVKIGALLSLVFGSAGAEIIGSNIMKEGDMNPMIGGKKKCAIFGFCDIRNFTEVTELLHEDIMLFVNKIGQLVHSSVYRYGGSANKNIGQAFLMVWPLPDNSYKINNRTNDIVWKRKKYVSVMSDFSILSFIKTIVKIHKEPAVLQYRNDKRLVDGLGEYQVKMGFGLHIGWAIEGAIGSEHKIDASYLSPNVNMASRLEAATRQYGVNILISEQLYDLSTPQMKQYLRQVDRVTVKGSQKPIRIFTIDLRLDNISAPMDKTIKYKNEQEILDVEMKRQINMEFLEDDKIDSYSAQDFIRRKKQLSEVMVDAVSEQFKKRFENGLQNYLKGKWSDAHLHLQQAQKYSKGDGPTRNLLNYIKRFDYVCPATWKEYRPLTQK